MLKYEFKQLKQATRKQINNYWYAYLKDESFIEQFVRHRSRTTFGISNVQNVINIPRNQAIKNIKENTNNDNTQAASVTR